MIRCLLADDQPLVRAGLGTILQEEADLQVVGEASDGEEAVQMAATLTPDVILMDVRMPKMDGIEATKTISLRTPGSRIIILTTFDLDQYVYQALKAGASGFLLKDMGADELVRAVRVVASGDALLAPSVTRRLIARFSAPGTSSEVPDAMKSLTEREREVLTLVARGLSNGEIAQKMFLGETTVKTHVAHILSKLDLRDRVQAVVMAYETGIVLPGLN